MSVTDLFAGERVITVRTSCEVHRQLKRQAAMRELSLNRHCQELLFAGIAQNAVCRDALEVLEGYWRASREVEISRNRESQLLVACLGPGRRCSPQRGDAHHAGGPVPVPVS